MPSVSKKQHNLMAMVANDPAAAKRVGIKPSVGKDFMAADKGKKFAGGGLFKGKESPAEEKAEARALKSGKISPKQYVAGEKREGHSAGAAAKAKAIKSGALSPSAYAAGEGAERGGLPRKGGGVTKMARGGGVESKGKTKGKMK